MQSLLKYLHVSFALALLLATSAALGQERAQEGNEPNLDVFELLSAEWADNKDYTCNTNPHVISFSDDRQFATFSYQHPPDRSHWTASLHTYRLSPEESKDETIIFKVLDHGRNWLALQRLEDETEEIGSKPQRWKLTLVSGDANYKWHLYGAAAGKNSLLRGVRCKPEDKIIQEESDIIADANLEDILMRLVGRWEAPGRIMGRPITYRAEGKAVLQGAFVRIDLRDLSVPARYEAIILIGKAKGDEKYIAHWLDVFGADASAVVGVGEYDDEELTLRFEQDENSVVNIFRFHRSLPLRADRFELVTLSIDKATQAVSETASYAFKKIEDR
jgi:hypothetical protein